jgi:integrase
MSGHIRKRTSKMTGKTSYQARIPVNGKDVVETFRLRRDGERWLSAQAAAVDRGDFLDPRRGNTQFVTVAEEWRNTWSSLAPKTIVGYESILHAHVLPAFGSMRVSTITPERVQKFANDISSDHAANTTSRVMDVLRAVLRVAVERRYIAANPCDATRLPRRSTTGEIEINPLSHAEVELLVAALPEHWRTAVLLDAYTGLRAGELWALRRRDVDVLHGDILVDEALKEVTKAAALTVPESQRITPSLIVGPTKTYAKRKVSVPSFLRELLAEHLAAPLAGGQEPESFIFTTPTGEAVRHNLFYKRFFTPAARSAFPERTRAAEERAVANGTPPAQASPFRFHDLRHGCATWLIAAGAHPLQLKARLGHSSIRVTMDIYGHLWPSVEPELADLLETARDASRAQPAPVRIPRAT